MPLLKGGDAQRAQALRHAAQRLGLRLHLALTEIHQCWDTDGDEEEPELYDLIDSGTQLNYWIDTQGHHQSYGNSFVTQGEEVWLSQLGENDLVETEFEGWMGNYGNTANYWYRRAALVLWRETDHLKMHFLLDYDQALASLTTLTQESGNAARLTELIAQADHTLARNLRDSPPQTFAALADIAAYLGDADAARRLLITTPRALLTLDTPHAWLALQQAYGTDWCLALLEHWQAPINYRGTYMLNTLSNELASQLRSFVLLDGDVRLAHFWIQRASEQVKQGNEQLSKATPKTLTQTRATQIAQIATLLNAAAAIDAAPQLATLIELIIAHPKLYPAEQLTPIALGIDHATTLRQHIAEQLKNELAKGVRQPNDWSISVQSHCNCADCQSAMEFVHSSTESTRTWPLAEARRRHITQVFHDLELPINCSEIRQGSPYKLVMRKATDLAQQDLERHARLQQCYERLIN
jgi:hypothetical protein